MTACAKIVIFKEVEENRGINEEDGKPQQKQQ